MPIPNDYALPTGVEANIISHGFLAISPGFVKLLVDWRNAYDWPADTGKIKSQQTIIDLEADVAERMRKLNIDNAHTIVTKVSEWAGNNKRSHDAIVLATPATKNDMIKAIHSLGTTADPANALDVLSNLPGLSLVIASKVYRFCCPLLGAAVDRHASYFFNSLDIVSPGGRVKATHFRREWQTGRHTTSRLANFTPTFYVYNRREFTTNYLPMLRSIATSLNALPVTYRCAAAGEQKQWRPTDVEMAVYFWSACNGKR